MPSHYGKTKRRRVPGGRKALSRKVALVRREEPRLSARQAVGKAAGILRHQARKKRRRRR